MYNTYLTVQRHLALIRFRIPTLNLRQAEIKRSSQLRTLLKRVVENRTWKNSGPYGIWTHDLRDTGAALYQLGAGQCVGSKGSLNFISLLQCNYMNFIYLKSSFITLMVYFANTKTQFFAPFGENIMIFSQHFPSKIARFCCFLLRFHVPSRRNNNWVN